MSLPLADVPLGLESEDLPHLQVLVPFSSKLLVLESMEVPVLPPEAAILCEGDVG